MPGTAELARYLELGLGHFLEIPTPSLWTRPRKPPQKEKRGKAGGSVRKAPVGSKTVEHLLQDTAPYNSSCSVLLLPPKAESFGVRWLFLTARATEEQNGFIAADLLFTQTTRNLILTALPEILNREVPREPGFAYGECTLTRAIQGPGEAGFSVQGRKPAVFDCVKGTGQSR